MTRPTQPHLSPEAAELAARHQLGALEGTFSPKRLSKPLFALYIFTIAHLLAMFVIPGLMFFWWLRRYPDFSRKQAAKRLHLFEHGMIVHPQSGDGMVAIRWDSVRLYQNISQKIINGVPGPIDHVYSAVAPGRVNATITDFYEGPQTWGPHMQGAVLRAQGPAVLESILEGQRVNFGDFSLSRTGVTTSRSGHLPWSDVQEIQVGAGRVHIMRTGESGRWCSVAVSDIANFPVFLTVAENLSA
ncbi:hypothetical protein GCM10010207_11990 [Streptomyces atratus]|uniref:DUF6585 family protein n=1 Tax=Streptomyces atratus TaxID=1893 RepID=UPI0016709E24|nr:DUF6585 family protein [Streptomyces atratus]GGT14635.1 hypothetical protein GCM10010207_11990 [Streptomyces atratus]